MFQALCGATPRVSDCEVLLPPLRVEQVKASPDNVAKAKYLVDKLSMKKEDVEAAFKACGMAVPTLPDTPTDNKPEDAAKSAREDRAAALDKKD